VTARRRALVVLAAALAAVTAAACTEVTTDPNSPVAIAFDSLPAPSVVAGDTMRDPETGAVVPLAAQAFNSHGDSIHGVTFTFFPRDTGSAIEIVDGNLLVGKTIRASQAGIVASLNGLQLPQSIYVVPRPDALVQATDSVPALVLIVPDGPSNVSKDSLRVRVRHDTTTADTVVRSWIVHFEITDSAKTLADSVRLVNDAGIASTVDTTDASGLASRKVRVFAKAGTSTGTTDSVVVFARSSYRGAQLPGSAVRFVLPVVR
jgi:hypothetical protein